MKSMMKAEMLRPGIPTLSGYFIVSVAVELILVGTICILMNDFILRIYSLWAVVLLFPAICAFAATWSTRQCRLTVHTELTQEVRDRTERAMNEHGLHVKNENEKSIVFESSNRCHRTFDNWFGTELVAIKMFDGMFTVTGPYRIIDALEIQLRLQMHDLTECDA